MIGAVLAATVLFFQAAPAATSVSPSPAAAPASTVSPVTVNGKKASAKPDGSEVVCRTEPVLGTLFPKKICASRDQFAERTRQDQKETREATNLRPYKIPE
jgi:hypothetical protein